MHAKQNFLNLWVVYNLPNFFIISNIFIRMQPDDDDPEITPPQNIDKFKMLTNPMINKLSTAIINEVIS